MSSATYSKMIQNLFHNDISHDFIRETHIYTWWVHIINKIITINISTFKHFETIFETLFVNLTFIIHSIRNSIKRVVMDKDYGKLTLVVEKLTGKGTNTDYVWKSQTQKRKQTPLSIFVSEKVALGSLVTRYVRSSQQIADIFTKSIVKSVFHDLRDMLGIYVNLPSQRHQNVIDMESVQESNSNS